MNNQGLKAGEGVREKQKGRPLCAVGVSGGICPGLGRHLSGKTFFRGCRETQRLGKPESPVSPALAGRFFTTEASGKPRNHHQRGSNLLGNKFTNYYKITKDLFRGDTK